MSYYRLEFRGHSCLLRLMDQVIFMNLTITQQTEAGQGELLFPSEQVALQALVESFLNYTRINEREAGPPHSFERGI